MLPLSLDKIALRSLCHYSKRIDKRSKVFDLKFGFFQKNYIFGLSFLKRLFIFRPDENGSMFSSEYHEEKSNERSTQFD
jgi:hypothetical protein